MIGLFCALRVDPFRAKILSVNDYPFCQVMLADYRLSFGKETFKKILWQKENIQHFLLFQQCFQPYERQTLSSRGALHKHVFQLLNCLSHIF